MNIVNPNAHHRLLAQIAEKMAAPWHYLEIGCCEGDSLLTVLRSGAPAHTIVCDNWSTGSGGTGRGSNAHIKKLLAAEPVQHLVEFRDGDSRETVPELRATFDLINVDGDHSYAGAALDLMHAWPLLRPHGVLVFDDICHPQHQYLSALAGRFSSLVNCQPFHSSRKDYGVCAWRKPL